MNHAGFRQEEAVIGEYRYRVTQLDTLTGIDVAARLVTKFGAALSDGDPNNAFQAVGAIAQKLTAEEVKYYVTLFAARTEVILPDGKEPYLKEILAVHFAGRYGDLIDWLRFCFEVNFRDFFAKVRERIGPLVKLMMQSGSSSPSTSNDAGSSGDS
jgi:hypothetical protein